MEEGLGREAAELHLVGQPDSSLGNTFCGKVIEAEILFSLASCLSENTALFGSCCWAN